MQRSRNLSAALLLAAFSLAGCDLVNTAKEAFQQSEAVSAELEQSLGVKPFVGFNWNNGEFSSANVTFEQLPANRALPEIAEITRTAIRKGFGKAPKQIVISFVLKQ